MEEKKEIKLKKLKGKHFYKLSILAKKLNLDIKKIMTALLVVQKETTEIAKKGKTKKEIDEIMQRENANTTSMYIDLIVKEIFEKLYLAEKELTDLLVELTELTKSELEGLEFQDYMKLVKGLISDKGFLNFTK
jgi:hypothetical protein